MCFWYKIRSYQEKARDKCNFFRKFLLLWLFMPKKHATLFALFEGNGCLWFSGQWPGLSVRCQFLWIPVIQQKCFVSRGFWVRRYEALVVSVPIPLRTQRAGAPTRHKHFRWITESPKKYQRTLPPNCFYPIWVSANRIKKMNDFN